MLPYVDTGTRSFYSSMDRSEYASCTLSTLGQLMYCSFALYSYTASWFFKNLSKRFLNEFTLGALSTSVGSEFQELTTLYVNDALHSFFDFAPSVDTWYGPLIHATSR